MDHCTITIFCSQTELGQWQELARAEGLLLEDWIRGLITEWVATMNESKPESEPGNFTLGAEEAEFFACYEAQMQERL